MSAPEVPRGSRAGAGRVPPHNLQAEESLLGAMLLSKDAIAIASERLRPEDFYKPAHGHVFDAITALNGAGEPADPVTVADELRRAGLLDAIGGPATLVALQAGTPATSNAGRYSKIIEDHALLRRMIGVAGEIAELGYELPDDVAKAVDHAEAMVFEVAQRRVTDTMAPIHDLLDLNLDRLEQLYERGQSITGVPTGFTDLDELTSGLQPNALYVIGARPSAGKTALALCVATHAALEVGRPVLLFSLEMGQIELTQRMLCSEARVDSKRVRNGNLTEADWGKIAHATGRLADAPIWIDDNANLTIMEIRSKARRLKSRVGDLGLIVVDYLQLMTGRSSAENRQVEVSEISRGLKILARELECPVIALSQLSRQLEMRADKRPMLADLRESGCLPASARLRRADTGAEVTLGELVVSDEQPLVWTVDEHGELSAQRLVRTFPTGVRPVFRMRLKSGREVDATANHRFLTAGGWTRLDELDTGSLVAVPRHIPAPKEPVRWDDDDIILLARRLGDDPVGPGVNTESVPREAFGLSDDQTALFLRHLWATGGSITHRGPGVRACWSSTSRQLAEDVRDLLLRFGVRSRIGWTAKPGDRRSWCMRVDGAENEMKLLSIVGCPGSQGDRAREADPADSDVCWDEIVAIEPLGDLPTFDATVDETHNFIANGVVAHNSIEQDADVVMFIYRDEVYNADSPDRGTAEIIVAKHRNGPTGMIRLAFLDHYTKFANMAKTV